VEAQYDLFEIVPDSSIPPRWIGAAANLQHVRRRLQELAQVTSAVKYFVREFCSCSVVASIAVFGRQGVQDRAQEQLVWSEGASMKRFGLFEWRNDGFPYWVDEVPDLQQAKRKIQNWAVESPDSEYFAQDFVANVIVASTRDYLEPSRQGVNAKA
jgi:hypothetical protein